MPHFDPTCRRCAFVNFWITFTALLSFCFWASAETEYLGPSSYDQLSREFGSAANEIRLDPRNSKAAKTCEDIYTSVSDDWRLRLNFDCLVTPDNGYLMAGLHSIWELLAGGQVPDPSLRSRIIDTVWRKLHQLPERSAQLEKLDYYAAHILLFLEDERGLDILLDRDGGLLRDQSEDEWDGNSPIEKFAALKKQYADLAEQFKQEEKADAVALFASKAAVYEMCWRRKAAGDLRVISCSQKANLRPDTMHLAEHLVFKIRSGGDFLDPSRNQQFMTMLSKLAQDSNETAEAWAAREEGNLMSAKLILLARDYQRRPEIYQEVLSKFFIYEHKTGNVGPMVALSAEDPEPFCKPFYRLPFELAILAPSARQEFSRFEKVTHALSQIADKKSLITLQCLLANLEMPVNIEELAIWTLIGTPSRESLTILLNRIVLESDRLKKTNAFGGELVTSTDSQTMRAIRQHLEHLGSSFSSNQSGFQNWKVLLTESPSNSFTDSQREALSKMQEVFLSVEKQKSERKSQTR